MTEIWSVRINLVWTQINEADEYHLYISGEADPVIIPEVTIICLQACKVLLNIPFVLKPLK
jgi:hypothetical protein